MKIRLDTAGGPVATIVIDNPGHKNALTLRMWEALAEACDRLAADPGVRAVVLRGAGDSAFSSGADLSEFLEHRHDAAGVAAYDRAIRRGMDAVRRLPMPVIARLSGLCVGGGVALAAMADFRIADDRCRVAIPAGKLGIAYRPEWIARLSALIGPGPVTELLLTARMFPAETALRWGYISQLCPLDALDTEVDALARTVAALAPLSLRASKTTLAALEPPTDSPALQELLTLCDQSADYRRGVDGFLTNTTPVFEGN